MVDSSALSWFFVHCPGKVQKTREIVSWQGPSLVWNDGIEETKIMTWQEFQPIGIWKLGGVGWWLTSSGIELYSHRLLNRTEMNRQAIANSAKHHSLLSLLNRKWNLLKDMNRKEIVFWGSIYECIEVCINIQVSAKVSPPKILL